LWYTNLIFDHLTRQMPLPTIDQNIEAILSSDPSASNWLKNALRDALKRDPVDAANDAELLAVILSKRAMDIHGQALAHAQIAGAASGLN
jgi:hypothetical protein